MNKPKYPSSDSNDIWLGDFNGYSLYADPNKYGGLITLMRKDQWYVWHRDTERLSVYSPADSEEFMQALNKAKALAALRRIF